MKTLYQEFKSFLFDVKVVSLATAFVVGTATNDLVKTFVDTILMAIINPLIPQDSWTTATLSVGPFHIMWGAFLSAFLHFAIIMLVIFLFSKALNHSKS